MLRIRTRGFKKKGNATFIVMVKKVIQSMENNPNFPDPSPSLAVLQNHLDVFIVKASLASGGDKDYINERNLQRILLTELIFKEAAYVLNVCSGTLDTKEAIAKVSSSGFEVVKKRSHRSVTQPQGVKAKMSGHPGTVNLEWQSISGTFYIIEKTSDDPASANPQWEDAGITTRRKFTIGGLPSLTYLWFRVTAIFSGGRKSIPSNPVKCIVG